MSEENPSKAVTPEQLERLADNRLHDHPKGRFRSRPGSPCTPACVVCALNDAAQALRAEQERAELSAKQWEEDARRHVQNADDARADQLAAELTAMKESADMYERHWKTVGDKYRQEQEKNRRQAQEIERLRDAITDVLHGRKMDRVENRNDDGMDMARIAKNLHYPDWWYDRLNDALSTARQGREE